MIVSEIISIVVFLTLSFLSLSPLCLIYFILFLSVDDHGIHGEMRNDAMNVAASALDTNPEEKDISKHIKVRHLLTLLS